MKCSILIDAIRDLELDGTVESVSEYPIPSASRYTAHIKEYSTEIASQPTIRVRTGMTSKLPSNQNLFTTSCRSLAAVFRMITSPSVW